MKLPNTAFAWAVILSTSAAFAADKPLARLTVRSYSDLTNAITRLAAAVNPSQEEDVGLHVTQISGLTNFGTFDAKRPWEVAVWYGGAATQPLVAIKAPAPDAMKFKEGMSPAGALRTKGQDWIQMTNGLTVILFNKTDALSEAEKSLLNDWEPQAVTPPLGVVDLKLSLNEPLRQQALAMLPFGKLSASQALAAQGPKPGSPINPAGMDGMVNAFFDSLQTFVTGLQDVDLGLDLSSDTLAVESSVSSKPGTDLARFMEKPRDQVKPEDMSWVAPDSAFSIGAYVGKDPALLKLAQQMIGLGLQMQNVETNAPVAKDIAGLVAKCLPVVIAGSVDLKDKFSFAGVYRFPGANLAETYGEIKRFMTNGFQAFVGKDKIYSAGKLIEKQRTINGVAVDRFSMTINADSPLFNLPGQKQQLQAMWPDGKLEFDYAIKDDHLLVASGDRMKELVESAGAQSNRKRALKLGEGTILAGYINPLSFARQSFGMNPDIPDDVKEKLGKLDTQGTGIEFQVRADRQLICTGRIPLKLIQELGKLKPE